MGGGGDYYDRDVTSRSRVKSSGYSDIAEETLSRRNLDSSLLPKNRKIVCLAKHILGIGFDETGSMGRAPKTFFDKVPMMAAQLEIQKYLNDPQVCIAGIGDILSDRGPIQICDPCRPRDLDVWLAKLWLEGNGGGQARESYEMTAYFFARMFDMPNAEIPILLIAGDEGFRDDLTAGDLEKHFGGKHEGCKAQTIFNELKEKFKGNIVHLHRRYDNSSLNEVIVKQWQDALGEERVVIMPSDDMAITDVTLGVVALASGTRTLDEYCRDMKAREQTDARIREVKKSLEKFAAYVALRKPAVAGRTPVKTAGDKPEKKPAKKPATGKKNKDWKVFKK